MHSRVTLAFLAFLAFLALLLLPLPRHAAAEGRLAFYLNGDRLHGTTWLRQYEPFFVEVYANGMGRIDAVAFSLRVVDYGGGEQPDLAPYGSQDFGPQGRGINISSTPGEYVIGLGDCYGLGPNDRVLVARLEFLPFGDKYLWGRHPCYECESLLEIGGVEGAGGPSASEPVYSDCNGELLQFDYVNGPFLPGVVGTEATSFGRVKALFAGPGEP